MKDSKPFVEPKPLLEALEYASLALGFDAWGLMKDWTRHGQLRMRGRADGVTMDFEAHWFDFLAKWGGSDEPKTLVPDQFNRVPHVGPGTSSDRPRGSKSDDTQNKTIKPTPPPRLSGIENTLYFDRPTQRQLTTTVEFLSQAPHMCPEFNGFRMADVGDSRECVGLA